MSADDRLDLTRLLAALHATAALVVAAGGLLLTGGRLPVSPDWSGPTVLAGRLLVGLSAAVILLALVTSVVRRARVVQGCGAATALLSALAVVPLVAVLGVTGWAVLAAVPLLVVSLGGLVPSRTEGRTHALG